jgi:hypothetical protein
MSFKSTTSATSSEKFNVGSATADSIALAQGGPRKRKLWELIRDGWYTVRCAFYGLRIAWVSVASLVVGALLFWITPQAQDLFMEVTGNAFTNVGYWFVFYVAVATFWGLPIYASSRWILSRFEEGSAAATVLQIEPVKSWVRRYIPPILTIACFGAVLLGQIMALGNAPTLVIGAELFGFRIIGAQQKAAIAIGDAADRAAQQCAESDKAGCLVARSVQIGRIAPAIAAYLAEALTTLWGPERVILVIYGVLAGVAIWFWLRRWLVPWLFKIGGLWTKIAWRLLTVPLVLALLLVRIKISHIGFRPFPASRRTTRLGHRQDNCRLQECKRRINEARCSHQIPVSSLDTHRT